MAVRIGSGATHAVLRDARWADPKDEYAGGAFVTELHGLGLDATGSVFVFAFSRVDEFFADLARSWRGWEGEKTWRSPEAHLSIRATEGATLTFTLRDDPVPTWTASVEVRVEGGEEMESVALALAEMFSTQR